MVASDFTYTTATGLSAAMAAGEVSSVELTEAAIARIERHDEDINAICVPDFENALTAAREADEARAKGETRPLLGIPMTVKESFNIAGLPTTWGNPAFKDFTPPEDALAVARVKAAGAVVLGKTNVPLMLGDLQSYNDIYGTTNNPWDLSRTPGGSSGGSAAGLAAGYGPLSIGSDIGGSLRTPAHFCGVYSHKPTVALVPSRGHTPPPVQPTPGDGDLAVIGPMARSATDLALLFDIMAEPDELAIGIAHRLALRPARHDDLVDYRVLVLDTHPLVPTASSVRTAISDLADGLAKAGATVARDSALLPDLVKAAQVYARLLMSTLGANYPIEVYDGFRARAAGLDDDDLSLGAVTVRSVALSHRDWVVADAMRTRQRQQWQELFTEFDVVLCPVTPTPAIPHDHVPGLGDRKVLIDGVERDYTEQLVWAGVATSPGLPSTVAPIGRSEEGLPIGAQFIGPMFEDHTTIRFAELLEREFGGFVPPPLA